VKFNQKKLSFWFLLLFEVEFHLPSIVIYHSKHRFDQINQIWKSSPSIKLRLTFRGSLCQSHDHWHFPFSYSSLSTLSAFFRYSAFPFFSPLPRIRSHILSLLLCCPLFYSDFIFSSLPHCPLFVALLLFAIFDFSVQCQCLIICFCWDSFIIHRVLISCLSLPWWSCLLTKVEPPP
jgi:hypothetical protein